LNLYEQFKPSNSLSKVEYHLICKFIKLLGALNVQEYFQKYSKTLNTPEKHLTKAAVETEFQGLFKLTQNICGQLYELIKSKNSLGL
jgi:hypothetical protein